MFPVPGEVAIQEIMRLRVLKGRSERMLLGIIIPSREKRSLFCGTPAPVPPKGIFPSI